MYFSVAIQIIFPRQSKLFFRDSPIGFRSVSHLYNPQHVSQNPSQVGEYQVKPTDRELQSCIFKDRMHMKH